MRFINVPMGMKANKSGLLRAEQLIICLKSLHAELHIDWAGPVLKIYRLRLMKHK